MMLPQGQAACCSNFGHNVFLCIFFRFSNDLFSVKTKISETFRCCAANSNSCHSGNFWHLLGFITMATGKLLTCWSSLTWLSNVQVIPGIRPQNQGDLKRRHLAYRAGTKWRHRVKPFLPLIIMGSVRSQADKIDELGPLIRTHQEY